MPLRSSSLRCSSVQGVFRGYGASLFGASTCGKGADGERISQSINNFWKHLLEMAVVGAAYFIAGRLGLAVPFTNGNISPVWPAAGVALTAFLSSYRFWPAVAIGAFLVNYTTGIPLVACIGIAVGNTLGPLFGAWLLRAWLRFQPSLARLTDVFVLLIAAAGGSAISAIFGASSLFITGVNAWSRPAVGWLMWCLGDTTGALLITPLALTFAEFVARCRRRHLLECSSLIFATVIACLLVFDSRIEPNSGEGVLVLALVPFVLWGAVRFGISGAAVINLLIAWIAVWETAHGLGPLLRNNPVHSAIFLQTFLAVIAVSGLAVAVIVSERARLAAELSARETLQESKKHYDGILECANDGILMLDAELRTRFVNRRLEELFGYPVAEMVGKSLFDFIFPEDVEAKKAAFQQRIKGNAFVERYESRYRRKDGSELCAKVSTVPIFDHEGRFDGAIKWFRDLSEEKRTENERRGALETVMLLSRAVEQTADSVLITDKNGVIEYVNSAFETMTGFSQDEVIGRTPHIVKSGLQGPDFYRNLWKCISEGHPFRGTIVNRKKSGELYWTEQSIAPITDEQGNITHYVSVTKDVTDSRKRQEHEMQMRLAREVQQRFYEPATPAPGLELAAVACPADETGGDYYDVICASDNSLYITVGDISGHGLGSALLMALTRAYVRSFLELQLDVAEVLARVNRMLRADLGEDRFVTLLLIRIAPSRCSFSYASAGHTPGFLLDESGKLEWVLAATGCPLGLFERCDFYAQEIALKPFQMLLLMTDGVPETVNSEDAEFGIEKVLQYLRNHQQASADEIVKGIHSATREFAGSEPQRDDSTLVCVRIKTDIARAA